MVVQENFTPPTMATPFPPPTPHPPWTLWVYLHGIGCNQKVCIIEEGKAWHFHNEDIYKFNNQHQNEFPNAADLKEHGASQEGQ